MSDNVIRHLPEWMAVNGGMRYHFSALRVSFVNVTAKGPLPLVHSRSVTAISLVFFKIVSCYSSY
jgi:hypothetical protein